MEDIKRGDILYVEYLFRRINYIGKFTVCAVFRDIPFGNGTRSFVRLVPEYNWDLARIEAREATSYLDVGLSVLSDLLRTEDQWKESLKFELKNP